MKKYLFALAFILAVSYNSSAQDFGWGFKGGPSLGFQKWDTGTQRDALVAFHGIAFVESVGEENAFSTFAQIGFHVRGGAVRSRSFNYVDFITGEARTSNARTQRYEFNNVSISLGAKQKFDMANSKYYYLLGVRGDYTIFTNLKEYEFLNERLNTAYYPENRYVRKFNYGLVLGGGWEKEFSEFVTGLIEITVNPDLSKQYRQGQINNVYNPFTMSNYNVPSREFSSVTLEISVGVRFLTKVEYVD